MTPLEGLCNWLANLPVKEREAVLLNLASPPLRETVEQEKQAEERLKQA